MQGGIFLKNRFEVYRENDCIGWANVMKEGLYYRICCNCRLNDSSIFRVVAICANYRQSLGILVPETSGFNLTARIPVKKIDVGTLHFQVEPLDDGEHITYTPISVNREVKCISHLEESRLFKQNGRLFLAIKNDYA